VSIVQLSQDVCAKDDVRAMMLGHPGSLLPWKRLKAEITYIYIKKLESTKRKGNTNYKTKHVTEFPSEKEENMPIPFSFF